MSLYCGNCRRPIGTDEAGCWYCRSRGLPDAILCDVCGGAVPAGQINCFRCVSGSLAIRGRSGIALVGGSDASGAAAAPPPLPGLPAVIRATSVPEVYQAGRYGVSAQVSIPSGDVEIMNLMGQVVVILHTLAEKMNHFQGHMDSTRQCIKGCRNLATDLQDEIEKRRGPQG